MEQKLCKKCGRPLPEGYKSNYCENCLNVMAEHSKKRLGIGLSVGGSVLAISAAVTKLFKFIKR